MSAKSFEKWWNDYCKKYNYKKRCVANIAFEAGQRSRDEEVEELKLIISGKTFYDVEKATARRCAEIADNAFTETDCGEYFEYTTDIATAIKEEFKLTKEPQQ